MVVWKMVLWIEIIKYFFAFFIPKLETIARIRRPFPSLSESFWWFFRIEVQCFSFYNRDIIILKYRRWNSVRVINSYRRQNFDFRVMSPEFYRLYLETRSENWILIKHLLRWILEIWLLTKVQHWHLSECRSFPLVAFFIDFFALLVLILLFLGVVNITELF